MADVLADTSSLADSVESLAAVPQIFVISAPAGVDGVATRADLQRPAVAMVALSLILASEAALTQLIRENFDGDDWQAHVSEDRLAKATEVLEERRRHNVELGLLDCIMLGDRLTLVRKHPELVSALGLGSRKHARAWFSRLSDARDVLAHGGDLLSVRETPEESIQMFVEIRRFGERPWGLVKEVPWYWGASRSEE